MGEMGEGGQKVQSSSYNINKFWGCNVQHGDLSELYCIFEKLLIEWILKEVSTSHHKKKIVIL